MAAAGFSLHRIRFGVRSIVAPLTQLGRSTHLAVASRHSRSRTVWDHPLAAAVSVTLPPRRGLSDSGRSTSIAVAGSSSVPRIAFIRGSVCGRGRWLQAGWLDHCVGSKLQIARRILEVCGICIDDRVGHCWIVVRIFAAQARRVGQARFRASWPTETEANAKPMVGRRSDRQAGAALACPTLRHSGPPLLRGPHRPTCGGRRASF